jgi:hypothetical protein
VIRTDDGDDSGDDDCDSDRSYWGDVDDVNDGVGNDVVVVEDDYEEHHIIYVNKCHYVISFFPILRFIFC